MSRCNVSLMTQLLGNALTIDLKPTVYETRDDDNTAAQTGAVFLSELAAGAVDVWGADVGRIRGVSADEIFVVLQGRANVTFEDTDETISIGPGDVVRLYAGQHNSWETIEPIRKVSFYVPTLNKLA
jgi:uncharacterized cupin superfamily protein